MATVCFASGPACACKANMKCWVVFEGDRTRKVEGGGQSWGFSLVFYISAEWLPSNKDLLLAAGRGWNKLLVSCPEKLAAPGQNNEPGQDGGDVTSGRSGRFCLTAGPVVRSRVYSILRHLHEPTQSCQLNWYKRWNNRWASFELNK